MGVVNRAVMLLCENEAFVSGVTSKLVERSCTDESKVKAKRNY
jgi:hypothetical protein